MSQAKYPPRLEQPDSPGRWWFSGEIRLEWAQGSGLDTGIIRIGLPQPFDVIEKEGKLVIASPDDGYIDPDRVWVGWWVKQKSQS